MELWFSRSRVGRGMERLSDGIVSLFSRFVRPGRPRGAFLPSQWFAAFALALMLCVPHEQWNNLYGVLFAVFALLLYWRDCAAFSLSPLSPAVLGLGVSVFLLCTLVTALWAAFPAEALRVALFYLSGFVLSYVFAAAFQSRDSRAMLCALFYCVLLITALYGLLRLRLGESAYMTEVGGKVLPRLASTLEHAINYSECVAMLFPPALVWTLQQETPRRRVLLTVPLLIPLAALLLTYARTGYLALGAALFLLLCMRRKKLILPAVLVGVAALFLLPESIRLRLLSVFRFSNSSSSGRFVLWQECLRLWRTCFVQGLGLGQANFYAAYAPFSTGTLSFVPPHSNMGYLEMWLSLGIVGFAAFAMFYFGVFFRLGRRVRSLREPAEKTRCAALFAALFGIALANIPEYVWFYPRVLFLWCVLFGLALVPETAGSGTAALL